MPTTQSVIRALELSLSGKKRPENLATGGIQHVLVDRVVFDGTEQPGRIIELSRSIPVGSVIDLAASSINGVAIAGASQFSISVYGDGELLETLLNPVSMNTGGEKRFSANGGLFDLIDSRLSLHLSLSGAAAPANATIQVRIVYYVR
jgi:hypothetical protein